MEYTEVEPRHFESIALSFSGGGFRAASYTLGCLSFMEISEIGGKKFTSLIKFISSASGGSITNIAYTASQRKGQSFDQFYKEINEKFLEGELVVDRVFEIMRSKKCWKERHLKSKNLINAFSMAYDELFFKNEKFGIYWNDAPGVVDDVCVNTTEFANGMLFRFQNAGVIGNKFLKFKKEGLPVVKEIRLADILACSSCFPVGFEPFMFPADFTTPTVSKEALEKAITQDSKFSPEKTEEADKKPPCFGIMDGGIDDNQGIDSFIRAEERLQKKNDFGYDLYLSCDVSSNYTSGYDFPGENTKSFLQRPTILVYWGLILILFGISLAGVLTNTWLGLWYAVLGISSLLLLLSAIFTIKGFAAYKQSVKAENTYGILILGRIFFFLKLRLSILLQLIGSRGTSAGYLAGVVFLKKIRRISYDRLFEKISEREVGTDKKELKYWRKFALQNAIYLLSSKNNEQRQQDLKGEPWVKDNPQVIVDGRQMALIDLMQPSEELQKVASLATEMDTTLWFDKNHITMKQPAALIATGQFTTCYNLLRYAFRFDSADRYWGDFQDFLVMEWSQFKRDPYYLYNIYGSKLIDKFEAVS